MGFEGEESGSGSGAVNGGLRGGELGSGSGVGGGVGGERVRVDIRQPTGQTRSDPLGEVSGHAGR